MITQKALLKRLCEPEQWPYFDDPKLLTTLNKIADKALIYQQLCEEMIKLCIECSDFLIQISLYPVSLNKSKKEKRMFGQLIYELEQCVDFPNKADFIANFKEINNVRIQIVHKLTKTNSTKEIYKSAKHAKNSFKRCYSLFEIIYNHFTWYFGDYKKIYSDAMLKDNIK